MGFFGRIGGSMPYTNLHNMNEDWIIATIKKLAEDWARYHAEWDKWQEDTNKAYEDLYNYVHDYFANLDVSNEINDKINSMVADGTFGELVAPYFNSYQQQIDVLSSRMDSFSHLAEGSTTGDAELIDIRTGYNGTTYPTAGDAVRGQALQVRTLLTQEIFNNGQYKSAGFYTERGYLKSDGIKYSSSDWNVSPFIPAFLIKQIKFNSPKHFSARQLCLYDDNKNLIEAISVDGTCVYNITGPGFVRVCYADTDTCEIYTEVFSKDFISPVTLGYIHISELKKRTSTDFETSGMLLRGDYGVETSEDMNFQAVSTITLLDNKFNVVGSYTFDLKSYYFRASDITYDFKYVIFSGKGLSVYGKQVAYYEKEPTQRYFLRNTGVISWGDEKSRTTFPIPTRDIERIKFFVKRHTAMTHFAYLNEDYSVAAKLELTTAANQPSIYYQIEIDKSYPYFIVSGYEDPEAGSYFEFYSTKNKDNIAIFGDSFVSKEMSHLGTAFYDILEGAEVRNYAHGAATCQDWQENGQNITVEGGAIEPNTGSANNTLSNQIYAFENDNYTPDVVLIHIGTNDGTANTPVVDRTIEIYDNYQGDLKLDFGGALSSAIDRIRTINPRAMIYICSPMHTSAYHTDVRRSVNALALKATITKTVAAKSGVYYVPEFEATSIGKNNAAQYTIDGVHPNGLGAAQIIKAIDRATTKRI